MPLAEVVLPEFDQETGSTCRALERVPEGQILLEAAPQDDDARPARDLARRAAVLGGERADEGRVRFRAPRSPTLSTPDAREPWAHPRAVPPERPSGAAGDAATSDADFAKPWALKARGRAVWTKSKFAVYRSTVMNLVHHGGQLTVYLRLHDVPVPTLSGPTADERRA